LNAAHTLLLVLRGPARSEPLVVHDPATRPRRRRLLGGLARWRGWDPVLVLLDVSRGEALAGQRERGRVVARGAFDRHWSRWHLQRPRLAAVARAGGADGAWSRVVLVGRATARRALTDVLCGPARDQTDAA
jgi:hypothetical protein